MLTDRSATAATARFQLCWTCSLTGQQLPPGPSNAGHAHPQVNCYRQVPAMLDMLTHRSVATARSQQCSTCSLTGQKLPLGPSNARHAHWQVSNCRQVPSMLDMLTDRSVTAASYLPCSTCSQTSAALKFFMCFTFNLACAGEWGEEEAGEGTPPQPPPPWALERKGSVKQKILRLNFSLAEPVPFNRLRQLF